MSRKTLLLILFVVIVIAIPIFALKYNETVTPQPSPTAKSSLKLFCPSTNNFCQRGKDIEFEGSYFGFGGDLLENDPVYAVFDGNLKSLTTTMPKEYANEQVTTIYLDSLDGKTRAVYYFIGQAPSSIMTATKGDIIGKIEGKIKAFDTYLVLQLIEGDGITNTSVRLTSQSFETR